MARGDGDEIFQAKKRLASDHPGPLRIRLRTGEELEVEKLGISGYVTARAGALLLGGTPSRDVVGKFCLGVEYEDGESGLIAQEEIAEIIDAEGNSIPYGNPKYPGHPDFDPRDEFDPIQEQIEILQRISEEKERRRKEIEEKGIFAVMQEEMKKYRSDKSGTEEELDGKGVADSEKKKKKKKDKKKKKKKGKKD